jgi:hypothetical protein
MPTYHQPACDRAVGGHLTRAGDPRGTARPAGAGGPDRPAVLIGREGVAVPDPLDEYRSLIGPWADVVDKIAMSMANDVAALPEELLDLLPSMLGSPFDDVHRGRAAEDLALNDLFEVRQAVAYDAIEEAMILEGLSRLDPHSKELADAAKAHDALAVDAIEHMTDLLDSAWVPADDPLSALLEPAPTESVEDRDAPLKYRDQYFGWFDWTDMGESIAVAREQAIRQALRDGAVVEAAPEVVRQVGTGRRPSGHVRALDRYDVARPRVLDRVGGIVGARRANRLAVGVTPLARGLENAPLSWLRVWRTELGEPEAGLNRVAARRAASLEMQLQVAQENLVDAEHDAEAFGLSDPDRAAVAAGRADNAWATIEELSETLHELNRELDQWTNSDEHRVLRAIAYEGELEIRVQLEALKQAERHVVDPPDHVTDLVGEPPELDAPERADWEATVRAVEGRHLWSEAARREGLEPPARDPRQERELDRQIDRLRAQRGLEPRAEASREVPGESPEMG